MSADGMSQARKRAWWTLGIWTVAGAGFLATFFAGGGVEEFPEDSLRHLAGAVFLGLGFVASWGTLWLTREKKGGPRVFDERDVMIGAQANQITLVGVLVWVFACTITLWTIFEGAGQVPVGWMWFLAYGSVILAFLASSVSTLVLDGRMGGNG